MNDASIRQHIHPSATSRWWQSWNSDGFGASWRKACDKAAIADLTFHDLRGSAVVRPHSLMPQFRRSQPSRGTAYAMSKRS